MRKLASIQTIVALDSIVGADSIEKATVLGWELVVKKGEFAVGDKVVYCEVDSILPEKPEFEFLRERRYRIRTIKLRGQISQGIAFPLSVLPKGKYAEGDDVTEVLGVKKHDPQAVLEQKEADRLAGISKNRLDKFFKRYAWYRRLLFKPTKRPFPAFIKKTDEDRIQLFTRICENEKDTQFIVTEKVDGQSGTFFVVKNRKYKPWKFWQQKYVFGVCSRNFQLLKDDGQSYWNVAKKYNLKEYMIKYAQQTNANTVVIQGEIIGPKIQGNKYGVTENKLYLFNHIIDGQLAPAVSRWGIECVPFLNIRFYLPPTIPECVAYAIGKSLLADVPREGVVVRNYNKGLSLKIINPDFLLKYE